MGPEGEQAILEEDSPAPLPPRPLPFNRLGLLPLSVDLSRSTQTREEGVTLRRTYPGNVEQLGATLSIHTGRGTTFDIFCPLPVEG